MFPYMFVIKGEPTSENRHYSTIAGAKIHIWVIDDDMDSALEKAYDYIRRYLWEPLSVEYAFEIQKEQLPHLHTEEQRLYMNALQFGIAADFVAYPIAESPDGSVRYDRP